MTKVHLFLLGRFRIERKNKEIQLSTRKAESLLAYLVLNPGSHAREKLASLFWGDSSDTAARNSLRNALAVVNRAIGSGLLLADRQVVEINPDNPLWVDALEFKQHAAQFLEEPHLEQVLVDFDLYRGDLLSDFYDDWIYPLREQYRSLLLETLVLKTEHMRSQSEYDRAIQYANKTLEHDQANERAHQHLMFCYMAQGNRSAALQQFESCKLALWEELGVEPAAATVALYKWIKQAPEELKPLSAQITNLPIPLTSFIGRKTQTAEIKQLLSSTRLLTITGAGGSGKTRLAIQVATDLLDAFNDGVWWVDLSSLNDESLLPQKVAKVLGVTEVAGQLLTETLVNQLESKQLLLLVDNCEHLIDASSRIIHHLLKTCPQLKIITTSRESLNVPGEQVWTAPTMSLPDSQPLPSPDEWMDFESIHLFVERAKAVRADFILTENKAPFIAQICDILDGIPLAIELAAARVKTLSTEQIVSRLDDRFKLLRRGSRTAIPRHQTLQAAIDWGYELLSEQERILFRRLAVFSGGWTLEASEEICQGDGLDEKDILDLLSNLVDKSLVIRERGPKGISRYHFLETIRQYAKEKLSHSKENHQVQIRHLDEYARLVESVQPHLGFFLSDTEMIKWMRILEPEQDNLRSALQTSQIDRSSVEIGLRIAGLLHWFWLMRSQFTEGRSWLEQLLKKSGSVSTSVHAQGYLSAGFLACWQGSFESGRDHLEMGLSKYRELNDKPGIAFSLHGLGFAANGLGDPVSGSSLFKESLEIAREINDKWLVAFALHFLAIGTSFQREYQLAQSQFAECIQLMKSGHGNLQGIAFSLFHLGRIARLQGDYALANEHHLAGLNLFTQVGDRRGLGYSLSGLACLAFAQENLQEAARLFGVVDSIRNDLGNLLEEILQAEYDHAKSVTRKLLGEETYHTAWFEGENLVLDQLLHSFLNQENSS